MGVGPLNLQINDVLRVSTDYEEGADATVVEVKADLCTTIVTRTSDRLTLTVYDVDGNMLHCEIFYADDYDVDQNSKESK